MEFSGEVLGEGTSPELTRITQHVVSSLGTLLPSAKVAWQWAIDASTSPSAVNDGGPWRERRISFAMAEELMASHTPSEHTSTAKLPAGKGIVLAAGVGSM